MVPRFNSMMLAAQRGMGQSIVSSLGAMQKQSSAQDRSPVSRERKTRTFDVVSDGG
jgi:hypothetical protein